MGRFILRRLGVILLSALCLTLVVFYLTNLPPNLEKLAKTEGNVRMSDGEVATWLNENGYDLPMLHRYGEWLGVVPGWTREAADGKITGRCISHDVPADVAPKYCGILEGDWGWSTRLRENVSKVLGSRLRLTGILMFWVRRRR